MSEPDMVSDVKSIFFFNYNICPTLDINVNLMLEYDINLIFIFNVKFGLLKFEFCHCLEQTSL